MATAPPSRPSSCPRSADPAHPHPAAVPQFTSTSQRKLTRSRPSRPLAPFRPDSRDDTGTVVTVTRERLTELWWRLPRLLRRLLVISAASVLFGLGMLFSVLPGPGIPFLVAGFATLAVEYAWARTYLERIRHHGRRFQHRSRAIRHRLRRRGSDHHPAGTYDSTMTGAVTEGGLNDANENDGNGTPSPDGTPSGS